MAGEGIASGATAGAAVGGPVGGAIGAVGGALLEGFSASSANKQAKKAARENRAWLERMSNTAHQREVKDLIAAGLNPILSAGGQGASSPGSSAAQVTKADYAGAASKAGTSAAQVIQQNKINQAQIDLMKQQENQAASVAAVNGTQVQKNNIEIESALANLPANKQRAYNDLLKIQQEIKNLQEQELNTHSATRLNELKQEQQKLETKLYPYVQGARIASDLAGVPGKLAGSLTKPVLDLFKGKRK